MGSGKSANGNGDVLVGDSQVSVSGVYGDVPLKAIKTAKQKEKASQKENTIENLEDMENAKDLVHGETAEQKAERRVLKKMVNQDKEVKNLVHGETAEQKAECRALKKMVKQDKEVILFQNDTRKVVSLWNGISCLNEHRQMFCNHRNTLAVFVQTTFHC